MINEILAYIRTVIETTYSTKTILPNPYELTDNTDVYLKNGYGVVSEDGTPITLGYKTAITINRTVSMKLTKRIYDTDLQSSSRVATEKVLFTESLALIKAIKANKDLKSVTASVDYLGDNGIALLEVEKIKYLTTTVNFELKYNEFH